MRILEEEVPQYRSHDFKDPDCENFVRSLLDQDHATRLGCGPSGINAILDHPYWKGIEWDLVPLKKFESVCKNIKAPAKRKKEKENLAVQIAEEDDISSERGRSPIRSTMSRIGTLCHRRRSSRNTWRTGISASPPSGDGDGARTHTNTQWLRVEGSGRERE